MGKRDLEILRHLYVTELNQKKSRGSDINKRDLGNKYPKKKVLFMSHAPKKT